MADKRKPIIAKTITEKGTFQFPHLNKPDTKFNADGEYKVTLRLTGTAAEQLKAKLDAAMTQSLELAKAKEEKPALRAKIKPADPPYKPETDKDTGEETGATLFTFKQKAKIKSKKNDEVFDKKPDLFDAKGVKFPEKTLIYGGTVGKIAFEAWEFYTAKVGAGITLRLLAAQVIELRSAGARDASDYGFGDEGEGLGENDSTGEDEGAGEGEGQGGEDF